MTLIFFLIFSIAILGIMFVFSLIRGVASFIFGRPSSSPFSGHRTNNTYSSNNNEQYNHSSKNDQRKVFAKNEGEYVKFEEIKE